MDAILKLVPWKVIAGFVWDKVEPYLKEKVANSESKIDDMAVKYLEIIVEELIDDIDVFVAALDKEEEEKPVDPAVPA